MKTDDQLEFIREEKKIAIQQERSQLKDLIKDEFEEEIKTLRDQVETGIEEK